ncbi:MAG TPA: hypothetical protein VGM32_09520 [Rhodopila sp.]
MTTSPIALAVSSSAASAPPRPTTLDPASIIAGCLSFVLLLFLPELLNDGDTLWQIRTGDWILDHRAIPAIDPFSFTAADRPWAAHEWLAETLMALAERAGGMPGLMALAAGATGLTAAVLLHHLRRFLPDRYALLALIVALGNAAPSMLARPHLIAWPCLALWCGGLVTARADRRAPAWTLLPVMLIWVNLHGSFMFGLLLPAAFMIEALVDQNTGRRHALIAWTRFIAAAWLVALINPDGLAGILFPIRLIGMQSLTWIKEWQPPDWSNFPPIEVIILGGLALGLTSPVRLPPIRLLILLALIHAALSHARNEQLVGIVGVLVLAEPLGTSLAPGPARPLGQPWRARSAGAALIALCALLLRIALPIGPDRTGATFAAVLNAVPPSQRAQPVLNDYSLGGPLIFNGVRPFIDGRADLYGDAFLSRYHRIATADRAELDRALTEYRITWTIFPANHVVVALLDQQPGWRRLLTTGGIVIHVRDDPGP